MVRVCVSLSYLSSSVFTVLKNKGEGIKLRNVILSVDSQEEIWMESGC